MSVVFKQTSESGLTPNGVVNGENMLEWLNKNIILCNKQIDLAARNGTSSPSSEGARDILKMLKTELFGDVYNT